MLSLDDKARILLDFQNCGKKIQGSEQLIGPENHAENNPVGDWPWMASIGSMTKEGKWEHRCGATLITDRHFLTSAHCFKNPRLLENHFSKSTNSQGPLLLACLTPRTSLYRLLPKL